MERKDFLKLAGVAGIATMLPGAGHAEDHDHEDHPAPAAGSEGGCALVPSETAGPYPLDLSGNNTYFRTDIREEQAGVDHRVRLRILGNANCLPMVNCRVDIWHCNVGGYYSGYTTSAHEGSQNHVSERFLRGIQMTDANGEVEFLTKFPGWYPGRTCHIHFQVYLNSMLQVTSQLCYPTAAKNALLTSEEPYTTWGTDPLTPAQDGIFSNGYALQEATLAYNEATGEYDSFLEVAIQGEGEVNTGLLALEPETGGQFKLGQNFPNPYVGATVVPFSLKNTSDITIELFDMNGRKVAAVERKNLAPGDHQVRLDTVELDVPTANYVYQLSVINAHGTHRQCKMMTAAS
ncbi:MAG: T9SS type A sorting domain-containing protein [Flavobacteriales bacterium]|nr:T9SS type A sorting domain-containing protein [Flavobacteriales bacterium]